ncbi:CLUMA_CG013455, isoform A [Clunio marinus]|uniref:CLUMA_CG013455, isoform A n=1 Tax=Clunio marinus TaxID=568069 RepID=A0A1J1IIW8_9DIPT|nr:CLUMA_CG013455, isoform A [Clunio marinus]
MENSQRLVDDDVPVVKPDNINDVPERFIYQAILATPIPQPFYTAINSTNSTFEIFTTTPMSRTSINGSTNPLNQTTSTTPAHPPTPPPTSPPTPPPPGEGQLEDCLLGNSDTKIKWVDGDGRLIHQNNCSKDLSYQYKKDILELEIANIIEDIHSTVNGVVVS